MIPYSLADIRQAFQGLVYIDRGHRYKWGGKYLTSTTTVVGRYKPTFNSRYWSAYKAAQRLGMNPTPAGKEEGLIGLYGGSQEVRWQDLLKDEEFFATRKEILKEWGEKRERAADYGTRVHAWAENYIQGRIMDNAHRGIHEYFAERPHLQPIACEVVVGNADFGVAGQVDLLLYDFQREMHVLYDYKTNEEIKKSNSYERMLPPFEKLDACNYNSYMLQMNIYAELLDRAGFPVSRLVLLHAPSTSRMEVQEYEVKLQPGLALAALIDFRDSKRNQNGHTKETLREEA